MHQLPRTHAWAEPPEAGGQDKGTGRGFLRRLLGLGVRHHDWGGSELFPLLSLLQSQAGLPASAVCVDSPHCCERQPQLSPGTSLSN